MSTTNFAVGCLCTFPYVYLRETWVRNAFFVKASVFLGLSVRQLVFAT